MDLSRPKNPVLLSGLIHLPRTKNTIYLPRIEKIQFRAT